MVEAFIGNLKSTIAWLGELLAGYFGGFAQWLGGVLAGFTGAPVSPRMAELAAIGVVFSAFILVLAFLRLLSDRSRGNVAKKPVRKQPETTKEMLADIELRMKAVKTGYKNGVIAEEAYLSRTRALYERARNLVDE